MTKEQIAELTRTADDMEMEPSHPEMNECGAALTRLLEERKRLLEALAHAVETLDDGPDKWPYTKAPDMWREAIAFAEEAAR